MFMNSDTRFHIEQLLPRIEELSIAFDKFNSDRADTNYWRLARAVGSLLASKDFLEKDLTYEKLD
jgi:hypothetical protein